MEEMKTGSAFNDATKIEESKTETDTNKVNDNLPETKQAENESLEPTNTTEDKAEKVVEPVIEPVVEPVVKPDKSGEETAVHSPTTPDEDSAIEDAVENDELIENPELAENGNHELDATSESEVSELHETSEKTIVENSTEIDSEIVKNQETESQDEEILDKMLGASAEMAKEDEDTVFNDILNESDAQSSEVIDENQRQAKLSMLRYLAENIVISICDTSKDVILKKFTYFVLKVVRVEAIEKSFTQILFS